MSISNTLKKLIATIIFSFGFSMATTSVSLCSPRGLMEEPIAPKALIKK